MVFYNGQKAHNCPMSLHELFAHPDIAKKVLYEDYHLIDVSKIPDDELSRNKWAGAMQFFMKNIYKNNLEDLLRQFSDRLREIALESMGLGFLQDILWYNKDSIKQSDEEKLRKILEEITGKKEVENIMGTFGEKYFNVGVEKGIIIGIEKGIERGVRLGREEGIERGVRLGREEGMEWGIEKEKYEIAKRMLDLGVDTNLISLATGLGKEQILKLKYI
jgi:hypothetical protein